VNNNGKINIEFEVMMDKQKEYINQLKEFAKRNAYGAIMTTYGNRPTYHELQEAPVLKIETDADTKTATQLGKRIMLEIFNCNETTRFDIVP
jgi:hypothetical protein